MRTSVKRIRGDGSAQGKLFCMIPSHFSIKYACDIFIELGESPKESSDESQPARAISTETARSATKREKPANKPQMITKQRDYDSYPLQKSRDVQQRYLQNLS